MISDQSGTENACKTQLGRFIIMIWVVACNNMSRYEQHFGSFYHNPTILETVSILASKHVNGSTQKMFFIEIQRQGIILAMMCLCQSKIWKSHVKNIFHIPRWPVGVKSNSVILRGVSLIAQSLTTTCQQLAVGAANIIDRMHIWHQCSVTMSKDILTTKYGFNLRKIKKFWKSNTIKANARRFTVVSVNTECWHTKFRHARYVWFGESLQKHAKIHCQSPCRGLESQQWSH